jgi:glycosyltransferase involved in cell wall biosynthesis
MPAAWDRRVVVHGFVEDLRPLYARASAVVTPLEVSAGTNIKVLEAMASGKPVISTPVGCAGLGLREGHDVLIRESWSGFADAVCDVLTDRALQRQIGREARTTAEQRFAWPAIAEAARASYLKLVGRSAEAAVVARLSS